MAVKVQLNNIHCLPHIPTNYSCYSIHLITNYLITVW